MPVRRMTPLMHLSPNLTLLLRLISKTPLTLVTVELDRISLLTLLIKRTLRITVITEIANLVLFLAVGAFL